MTLDVLSAESKINKEINQIETALENAGKRREHDRFLELLNDKCDEVYNSFNDWQIALIDLEESERKKHQVKTYEAIYDLLCFIETEVVGGIFDEVTKNCPNFLKMFNHFGKYCYVIEAKYDLQSKGSKFLEANPDLHNLLKSYLK